MPEALHERVVSRFGNSVLPRFGLARRCPTMADPVIAASTNMPGPLRAYADQQPLTATGNAIRPLLLGGPAASHAVAAVIWCARIVAVFAPVSVRRYRRAA